MYLNSRTKMRDITDGTTNSIALIERTWVFRDDPDPPIWAANWVGADRADKETRICRALCMSPEVPINGGARSNTTASSNHPGGVQATMWDGSVRFISENIDHLCENDFNDPVDSTLESLLAISDGNVVGEF